MWNQIFGVGDLDGAAFTELVAKEGIRRGVLLAPVIDPDQMRIKDVRRDFNLRNVHLEFLTVPRRKRLAFIREHVLSVLAPIDDTAPTWESVQPNLRPVIRHASYLANARLTTTIQGGKEQTELPNMCIAPGLHLTVAIDEPHRMMLMADHHLADWKVSFEDALEVALANLTAQPHGVKSLTPGLWIFPAIDSYTAARASLPALLRHICPTPLVAVPTRDVLMLADASNPDACDALLMMLSTPSEDERYPITNAIYRLEDDELTLWNPTSKHEALVDDYRNTMLLEEADAYTEEYRLLSQLGNVERFGPLHVTRDDDGTVRTMTVWTAGVTELLPRAHAVVCADLATGNARPPLVSWSALIAGGFLTPEDGLIRRWRTSAFPTAAWLEKNASRAN